MPDLILLIGLPGSGKSTLSQQLMAQGHHRVLISTDAIRAQLFGDEAIQGCWQQVDQERRAAFATAAEQIAQGQSDAAIYDATNVVRRQRRDAIALARQVGFVDIMGLWLDLPLALCLERNQGRDRQVPEAVLQRMHRQLCGAPPRLQDGLNTLVRYTADPGSSDVWGGRLSAKTTLTPHGSASIELIQELIQALIQKQRDIGLD